MNSIDLHIQSIFSFDTSGRIDGMNDWVDHGLPRMSIAFDHDGGPLGLKFGANVEDPDDWAARVDHVVEQRRRRGTPIAPTDQASFEQWRDELREVLADLDGTQITGGPAYVADPDKIPKIPPTETLLVTEQTAHCLSRFLPEWLADVPHQQPMAVTVLGDDAVAICGSVRKPPRRGAEPVGYQAGLETAANVRRRGYAVPAVLAWCHAVDAVGFVPVYSTSWDNIASQRTARRCELRFIGSSIGVD